jgi:putative transcriptional regulator
MSAFENIEIKKGDLLISEPFLKDPNFSRSVVLLCDNMEGHVGFVLNQKTPVKLGDVLEGWEDMEYDLYVGGPVEKDTLHFLHDDADLPEAMEISEGLYWNGELEILKERLKAGSPTKIKFLVGYSGWGVNQLEEEIKAKGWMVADSTAMDSFSDDEKMWQSVLRRMGGEFEQIANYPIDPQLN